jgi:hypothetical protein
LGLIQDADWWASLSLADEVFSFGAASTRTSNSGASIRHLRDRRMGIKSIFSRPIQIQGANVVSMLRATSKHQRTSSLLPPCCDYIATMLRPVLRVTSNISSSPRPPLPKPNITCLQHRDSTSAILKIHVCNIKHQG